MKKICSVFILCLALGCAGVSTHQVTINAIARPDAGIGKHYRLYPGNEKIDGNSLSYLEFANYAHAALQSAGFIEAESMDEEEITVFLIYSIGNPKAHEKTVHMPIVSQTGTSSANTYGTFQSYGNYGTFNTHTNYTPTYGVTGTIPITNRYTTCEKFIGMKAIDAVQHIKYNQIVELWDIKISNNDSSTDLRKMFPIMMAAATRYIGGDTAGNVENVLSQNDKEIQRILSFKKNAPKEGKRSNSDWMDLSEDEKREYVNAFYDGVTVGYIFAKTYCETKSVCIEKCIEMAKKSYDKLYFRMLELDASYGLPNIIDYFYNAVQGVDFDVPKAIRVQSHLVA